MTDLLLMAHIELHPMSESEIQYEIWGIIHDSDWFDYVSDVRVGIRNGISDIPSIIFEITIDIPKEWRDWYPTSSVDTAFTLSPGRVFDQQATDRLVEILDNFPFIKGRELVEYEI